MNVKLIVFSYSLLMCISCSKKHDVLSNHEHLIIENCIDYIKKNNEVYLNDCYLIKPYFANFTITNFFDSRDKSFVELFEEKPKSHYSKIEDIINKEYFNKYNSTLEELSSCKRSKYLLSFSGISDEMIIGYLNVQPSIVNKKELKGDYEIVMNAIDIYIFNLDGNGKITKVIKSGVDIW